MPGAVTFDFAGWSARYPELAPVGQPLAGIYFAEAGLYCANDQANPAFNDGVLTTLLWMVTAHIAWLNAPRDASGNPAASGQPASALVGRISSASEGSVSAQAEWKGEGGPSEEFWSQTKYGAAYWAASGPYRQAFYRARPTFARRYFPGWPVRIGGLG